MENAAAPIDLEKRAEQFIKLRDLKSEIEERHKAELKPINDAMALLKEVFAAGMDQLNVESVKTACGTLSFTTKKSAALADKDAFWTYVVATGKFELIDYKANVTAVEDHIENNNGLAPPGVNWSTFRDVNVRRPTSK